MPCSKIEQHEFYDRGISSGRIRRLGRGPFVWPHAARAPSPTLGIAAVGNHARGARAAHRPYRRLPKMYFEIGPDNFRYVRHTCRHIDHCSDGDFRLNGKDIAFHTDGRLSGKSLLCVSYTLFAQEYHRPTNDLCYKTGKVWTAIVQSGGGSWPSINAKDTSS